MGKAIRNFKRGLNQDEDVTPPEKQVAESSSATDLNSEASTAETKS